MHSLQIPELKINTTYPANLQELQPAQYLFFLQKAAQLKSGEIDWPHFRIELTYFLLNMVHRQTNTLNTQQGNAMRSNIFLIAEQLDSFLVDNTLPLGTIKNLIPTFITKKNTWYGPADAIQDLSFQEYIDAFYAYKNILQLMEAGTLTPDSEHLHKLTAILYYPVKLNGPKPRKRPPYKKENVAQRTTQVAKLSPWHHMASYYFFKASIEFLTTQDFEVNGHPVNLACLFENKETTPTNYQGTGLIDVLFAMADDGVFGTVQEVAKQNVYDVFLRLYQTHKEAERQKAKAKA